MRAFRRKIRTAARSILGAAHDIELMTSPSLPFVYVNNPKSGCSTIKAAITQSLVQKGMHLRLSMDVGFNPRMPGMCVGAESRR